jgi:hypothetical protein
MVSTFTGDQSFQRFAARITFTNLLDATTAVQHLRDQQFIVEELPSSDGTSPIEYLAQRVLDDNCITMERVRNYMKTLIHACDGSFVEIAEYREAEQAMDVNCP